MIKYYIRITPAITPAITPVGITPGATTAITPGATTNQNSLIAYNHFKPPKKAFNYKTYKSITKIRFWLVGMLKAFKSVINKIIRLIINRVAFEILLISINKILLKIRMIILNRIAFEIVLISNFEWSKVITKRYGRKSLN